MPKRASAADGAGGGGGASGSGGGEGVDERRTRLRSSLRPSGDALRAMGAGGTEGTVPTAAAAVFASMASGMEASERPRQTRRERRVSFENLDFSDLPPIVSAGDVSTPAMPTLSQGELMVGAHGSLEVAANAITPRILAAIQEQQQQHELAAMPPPQTPTRLTMEPPELETPRGPSRLAPELRQPDPAEVPGELLGTPSTTDTTCNALQKCRENARQLSLAFIRERRRATSDPQGRGRAAVLDSKYADSDEASVMSPSTRRSAKNRETAAVSRYRKRVYMESLEETVMNLERQCVELSRDNTMLQRQIELLYRQMARSEALSALERGDMHAGAEAAPDASNSLYATAGTPLEGLESGEAKMHAAELPPRAASTAAAAAGREHDTALEGHLRMLLAKCGIYGERASAAITAAVAATRTDSEASQALRYALSLSLGGASASQEMGAIPTTTSLNVGADADMAYTTATTTGSDPIADSNLKNFD
eukprot:ctg_135.g124